MNLSGFRIDEELYRGAHTIVYRAYREQDGSAVILRAPKRDGNPSDARQIKQEHEIRLELGEAGALHDGFAVSPDPGGTPLKRLIHARTLDLGASLWIACGIIERIGALHQRRIVHKDVNSHNVLVNLEASRVELLCHDVASRLPRETRKVVSPEVLEGILSYISPEQTGRMNRPIDYRSDFYSLGIVLYEMLTGDLPFRGADAMEIVHAHIARAPVPPHEVSAAVPLAMSLIVSKLLSKNAEDRYQSSHGIKADLSAFSEALRSTGATFDMVVGREDVVESFQIPQKLYGREHELASLMAAFDRASSGRGELMLVSGYSGIGKSVLVSEVHRPIVQKRGFFIAGKYEQYKRDIPYLALTQAFRDLIRQILTGSARSIATWKERLLAALGPSGQIIIDVIPEVGLIIGEQQPVPDLGPTESQNRFRLVFQNFIQVFADAAHPLVLFIDDLQWADSASLKLLQLLMTGGADLHLFVVGAYRDNEVGPAHPLLLALEEIERSGAAVSRISLGPLTLPQITELLADSLRSAPAEAEPLAKVLLGKTGGNPFFLIQFLYALHDEGLLSLDTQRRHWRWNVAEIRKKTSTENVVELMAGKLLRLPERTQNALKLAACIGSQFDLKTLSAVTEQRPEDTAADIWEAMREGLILPLSGDEAPAVGEAVSYRFLHDRVQQAVDSLIPEGQRKAVHLQIGQLMLKDTTPAELEDRVFDIVGHLNVCRDLITAPDERRRLAELNRVAGKRAKASTAYELALKHLAVGAELLPEGSWETDYDLTMSLTTLRAECEYQGGHFEEADKLFDVILTNARSVVEKVRVHTLKTMLLRHAIKFPEAIAVAIPGLRLVGLDLPPPEDTERLKALVDAALGEVKDLLRGHRIEDLIDRPEMTDPRELVAMDLLEELSSLGLFFTPILISLATVEMVARSLRHGNCRASPSAYATYGVFLGQRLGDFKSGHSFGTLALALSKRYGDPSVQCRCGFWLGAFISQWREHLSASLSILKESYELGVRAGDPVYAAYSAFFVPVHSLARGDNLLDMVRVIQRYMPMDLQAKYAIVCYQQLVHSLLGRTRRPGDFDDDAFREEEHVNELKASKMVLALQHYFGTKIQALFLADRLEEARRFVEMGAAEGNIAAILYGQLAPTEWVFYSSLILAGVHEGVADAERAVIEESVAAGLAKLKVWADHCPATFLHRYLLVSAEAARISGRELDAVNGYEAAIVAARAHGFVQNEAMACELAAKLHLARGRKHLAGAYIAIARDGYDRWGAVAKTRMLEERYWELQARPKSVEGRALLDATLDFTTVMKAAQTMSGEIVLARLLARMMRIIIENAGAQRGFLILETDEGPLIQAAGSADEEEISVLQSIQVDRCADISTSIVKFVERTGETIVADDAVHDPLFRADPYVEERRPRSILCTPIVHQKKRIGVLYLENNLVTNAFTPARLKVLELLAAQAAISLENASLYDTLEQKVAKRTREIQEKNEQLRSALQRLQETRQQLVVQEKLASLGTLTAGIAHELKNPLNFVNNFAELSAGLVVEVTEQLSSLPQAIEPDALAEITESLDLLRQNVLKIDEYGKKANNIINSMLLHARSAAGVRAPADLNALLAESVNLAYHGMRSKDPLFNIDIVATYDDAVGTVDIVAQDMSRVFINVINNAYDAVRQKARSAGPRFAPVLKVSTKRIGEEVVIRIRDNGTGIGKDVVDRVFNPFFTTKPAGAGTGLGLSISYDIVAQGHNGDIRVETEDGEFTEFIITLPGRAARLA